MAEDGVYAINLITLRDDASVDDFARFSAQVDQPTCLAQDVVLGFDVYAVAPGDGEGGVDPERPRVDVVEALHVRSWSEWEGIRDALPAMAGVVAEFERLVAPDGVRTIFATRIPPSA
jgi:hypothetical protein